MTYRYNGRARTTSTYTLIDLGFTAKSMIIVASTDNSEDLKYSWNGTDLAGEIAPGEPLTLNGIESRYIWIKSNTGSMEYRLWAWA